MADDESIGALNVYFTEPGLWPSEHEASALAASDRLAGILQTVRDLATGLLRDPRAAKLLHDQHEVNVATGILMGQHACAADEARDLLSAQAAAQSLSVQRFAAQMVSDGGQGLGGTS